MPAGISAHRPAAASERRRAAPPPSRLGVDRERSSARHCRYARHMAWRSTPWACAATRRQRPAGGSSASGWKRAGSSTRSIPPGATRCPRIRATTAGSRRSAPSTRPGPRTRRHGSRRRSSSSAAASSSGCRCSASASGASPGGRRRRLGRALGAAGDRLDGDQDQRSRSRPPRSVASLPLRPALPAGRGRGRRMVGGRAGCVHARPLAGAPVSPRVDIGDRRGVGAPRRREAGQGRRRPSRC